MPSFEEDGAQLFPAALDEVGLGRVDGALDAIDPARPGTRLYNQLRSVADLLEVGGPIGRVASTLIGRQAQPVRAILFDKRVDLNWSLGLHQDRTIAVRVRHEVPGYGPWSRKADQPHVQPPQALIDRMATLRVHLDDVGADMAPLLIVRGSHAFGRLGEDEIASLEAKHGVFECLACRGDIWAYRTAIVHGSGVARTLNRRRRVLQIDYSAETLPGGLEWALDLTRVQNPDRNVATLPPSASTA